MIFHLLTVILFLLKVIGIIDISWWLVIVPSVAYLGVLGFILLIALLAAVWAQS